MSNSAYIVPIQTLGEIVPDEFGLTLFFDSFSGIQKHPVWSEYSHYIILDDTNVLIFKSIKIGDNYITHDGGDTLWNSKFNIYLE